MSVISERVPRKTKSERIALFFKLLTDSDKKFTKPQDVHVYLRSCLKQIEDEHCPESRMILFSFGDFRYHEKLKIYCVEAVKHHIFIHLKGAYGIYRIMENESLLDFEFYASGNNRIIEIPSERGIPLWEPR